MTLRYGTSNGLLKDRTGVEDIRNHLGETRLRWLGHLERMDATNLVKRVREERVSLHLLEKCRHFIRPKTLLSFRVRTRVRVRARVRAGVSVNTFSVKHVFEQV